MEFCKIRNMPNDLRYTWMKNCLLILPLLLLHTSSFCQRDSIMKEIINHNDEKSVTIIKGRSLLLEKLILGDFVKVKEIKDYLISDIEDSYYAVFYPEEYWLILYWTKEYKELTESLSYDNYLQFDSFNDKIKPQNNELLGKILNQSKSESSNFYLLESIRNSDLPDVDKEFLTMNLDFLLSVNQSTPNKQELLNKTADSFLTKYPDSEFDNYVRTFIRNKLVPGKWGFGVETFIGYGWLPIDPQNLFKNNFSIGIDMDFKYTLMQLSFRALFGLTKTNQDIHYSKGIWTNNSLVNIGQIETSLGCIVIDNNDLKLTPYIGISWTSFSPDEYDIKKDAELKAAGIDMMSSCSFGINCDMKIGEYKRRFFIGNGPEKNYLFLRLRYSCHLTQFNKKQGDFNGNMQFFTIGIGGFGQRLEREY